VSPSTSGSHSLKAVQSSQEPIKVSLWKQPQYVGYGCRDHALGKSEAAIFSLRLLQRFHTMSLFDAARIAGPERKHFGKFFKREVGIGSNRTAPGTENWAD